MDCLLKYLTHESRYNREVKLCRMYRLMSRLSKANTLLIRSVRPCLAQCSVSCLTPILW